MVAAVVCAVGLLWMGLPDAFSEQGQTDFEAPYYALKVEDAGGNPWDHAQTVKARGGYVQHLMYPPHVLRFFRLFAFEDVKKAKDVFLASKLVCLAALCILWTAFVIRSGARGWFMAFAALGYNGTICRDLVVGNQSIFEQTLIWFGVFALLRGWLWLFCLLIIICGQAKILPLALLALVLLTDSPRKWHYFIGSIVACGLIAAGVYWWDPTGTKTFLDLMSHVKFMEPGGVIHPCARTFIYDLTSEVKKLTGGLTEADAVERVAYPVYVVYALAVAAAFMWGIRRRRDLRTTIFLAILTYILIAPRMKDYSYIIALVPTFELIRDRLARGGPARWVVLGVAAALTLPGLDLLWQYRSLMLAAWVWAISLRPATAALPTTPVVPDRSVPGT